MTTLKIEIYILIVHMIELKLSGAKRSSAYMA